MKAMTLFLSLVMGLFAAGIGVAQSAERGKLSDEQMQELVLRSYQYVAMFNVNNKFGGIGRINALFAQVQC